MPDILTRTENLGHCDNHSGLHPQYADFGFACVNWKPIPTSESLQNAEKDSDHGQEASDAFQRNLTQAVAAPETICISLPALRATILAALDDKTWLLYEQIHKGHILWSEDKANEERLRFCDEIERRLRGLQ